MLQDCISHEVAPDWGGLFDDPSAFESSMLLSVTSVNLGFTRPDLAGLLLWWWVPCLGGSMLPTSPEEVSHSTSTELGGHTV